MKNEAKESGMFDRQGQLDQQRERKLDGRGRYGDRIT